MWSFFPPPENYNNIFGGLFYFSFLLHKGVGFQLSYWMVFVIFRNAQNTAISKEIVIWAAKVENRLMYCVLLKNILARCYITMTISDTGEGVYNCVFKYVFFASVMISFVTLKLWSLFKR